MAGTERPPQLLLWPGGTEAGDAVAGAMAMAAAVTEGGIAGAVAGAETEVAGVTAAAEAEGAVDGTEAQAGAAKAVAGAGDCARADDAASGRARRAAEPEPWWAVLDSSTEEGVEQWNWGGHSRPLLCLWRWLHGLRGDGQLLTELEGVSGG